MRSPIIIALGGSIIIPDEINTNFLKKFRKLILKFLKEGRKFIIVAGGGRTARLYQNAASKIIKITYEDLDWIGIHATRINAHLLRTIFFREACPTIMDNPYKPINTRRPIIIASGWRPGWSTDYISILLAKRFGAKEVIIAGKPPYVYTRDPALFIKGRGAKPKPIRKIAWQSYRKIIGSRWIPGMSSPVDPIGAKLAQKLKLKAIIIKGTNLKNWKNLLEGKKFKGTIIG